MKVALLLVATCSEHRRRCIEGEEDGDDDDVDEDDEILTIVTGSAEGRSSFIAIKIVVADK